MNKSKIIKMNKEQIINELESAGRFLHELRSNIVLGRNIGLKFNRIAIDKIKTVISEVELLIEPKIVEELPPQLNKHDVIRSAIGDDKYNSLSRLIELHEMLNNEQGLDDEQYDEHEQLVSDLDNILPLH